MRDLNIEEISQISGGTGSSCAPPPPPCCGCGSVKESKGKKEYKNSKEGGEEYDS